MPVILKKIQNNHVELRFNRPELRNAISRDLLNEFQSALLELKSREEIRSLVLTGEGDRAFCAGADLKERKQMSPEEVRSFLRDFRDSLGLLESLPFPTIAVLNGDAFGGGLEIALACDIRLAVEHAIMALPETKLGIIPGAGGTQRLARLIGLSGAKDMIFTGRFLNAGEGKEYGVINRVLSSANTEKELESYLSGIYEAAPLSLKFAKKAIEIGFETSLEKGLDIEKEFYEKTLGTKDRLEGLEAFAEKRKPVYRGE
ncbi:MAG: enoyl-CoA hydratase/isomerase family protein [Leptospiraceae bacterium]|nr:enoyl-CoA hydratase/isomerase family protein [Leptospiraceae bacterium]MCP5499322.1 enoyl-CoA hydratase/isomerase family protein [Leptospiraceae bacterium]